MTLILNRLSGQSRLLNRSYQTKKNRPMKGLGLKKIRWSGSSLSKHGLA